MGIPMSPDGWNEWSRHVLSELERLNTCYERLAEQQNRICVEIARLQVKAGVWGFAAGLLPALGVFLWWLVTK